MSALGADIIRDATPLTTGRKRGPVARRRFRKGCFQLKDGMAHSFYYEDSQQWDGALATRKVRHFIGHVGPGGLSERAARREHDRIMQELNRKRGSVAPSAPGRSFADSVAEWRAAIAPTLSPATVRQRESYLKKHILPKFKDAAPHTLDIGTLQRFATELRRSLSRKTIINVLGAIFSILDYAGRTGTRVAPWRGVQACGRVSCWRLPRLIWISRAKPSPLTNHRIITRGKFASPKHQLPSPMPSALNLP